MTYDSLIIGGGPAGMMAALQLKRSGFSVALLERGEMGGLLRNANWVENYLGFRDGISGEDLISHFRDHLTSQKIPVLAEEVTEVRGDEQSFSVLCASGTEYGAATVVLATGTQPKEAGIEGEVALRGSRVFYEIADVPAKRKGASVAIIGGGDAAFDYALNLSERGFSPSIVMRGGISCLPLLKARVDQRHIPYRKNTSVTSIRDEGETLVLTSDSGDLKADYVLVAVGREPRYPRITTRDRKGLFFVGDVQGGRYRQVHIALGDALRAAMEISHFLTPSTV